MSVVYVCNTRFINGYEVIWAAIADMPLDSKSQKCVDVFELNNT